MTHQEQPFRKPLKELLVNAIHRRNAAACHEIERRHIEERKALDDYLFQELAKARGFNGQGAAAPMSGHGMRKIKTLEELAAAYSHIPAKTLELFYLISDPGAVIDRDDDPNPICIIAREMLACDPPYTGHGPQVTNPDQAESFIYNAADEPKIDERMSEAAFALWNFLIPDFKAHRAKSRRAPR
jgi:hypothetical protein